MVYTMNVQFTQKKREKNFAHELFPHQYFRGFDRSFNQIIFFCHTLSLGYVNP